MGRESPCIRVYVSGSAARVVSHSHGVLSRTFLARVVLSRVSSADLVHWKPRRNHFETDPPGLISHGPDAVAIDMWEGGGHVARPHLENWLDAIREGAPLNAPVEAGHRTVTICHLANIARELNRPLRWDPVPEQFSEGAAVNESLTRPRRNGFGRP